MGLIEAGLDVRQSLVRIDIACNDPDNGNFAGRAEQIQVGYDLAELECLGRTAPKIVELPDAIRFAGRKWPVAGCKPWIGNWCWNGYWMKIPDAVAFLMWLHRRKFYSLTCGEQRLYNVWRLDEPMGESDREFLDRMLGKPSNFLAAA